MYFIKPQMTQILHFLCDKLMNAVSTGNKLSGSNSFTICFRKIKKHRKTLMKGPRKAHGTPALYFA